MAASDATNVDAGGRELRVSNPDRVIFPATERTAAVTKLDIVNYYLAVDDGIMRALESAADDARALAQGRPPGIVLSTRGQAAAATRSFRSASRAGPPTTCRRRGSSSRPAEKPTRSVRPRSRSSAGLRRWGRSRSIPGRSGARTSTTPTSCASTSTRSRAPTSPTPLRVAGEARRLLDELGYVGFPKTSGGRGVHIYVRIEPRWTFTDVRHAAIAFGRELERRLPEGRSRPSGGRRSAASGSSSTTTRTRAIARSPRPTASGPSPALRSRRRSPGTSCPRSRPRTSRSRRCPRGSPGRRPRTRRSTTSPTRCSRCWTCTSATRRGRGRHALPTRLPEDARRAQAGPALARPRPPALNRRTA